MVQSSLPKLYTHLKFNLVFKNSFTIRSMFKHKERLLSNLCSYVIYKYMCALCNECYTGITSR